MSMRSTSTIKIARPNTSRNACRTSTGKKLSSDFNRRERYGSSVYFGPSQSHAPTVQLARSIPNPKAGQKFSPRRSANASGMKKGSPNGTNTRVSRANLEVVARSWFCCHWRTIAMMLSIGRVSMNAPRRGFFCAICVTTANVMDAKIQRTSPHIGILR